MSEMEIKKGDVVEYIDTQLIKDPVTGIKKSSKVKLVGVWDGEKVIFDDNTTVRYIGWLRKV